MTVNTYGYSNEWLTYVPKTGASGMGWLSVYIAYMGVYVLMMYTFDFARFGAKNDSEFHAKISFGTPFYLMAFLVNGLVGIFLITSGKLATISETGVVDQLILVLGEVLGLLFILITQTRINSANFYLATVNMQAFFEKIFGFHLKKMDVGYCGRDCSICNDEYNRYFYFHFNGTKLSGNFCYGLGGYCSDPYFIKKI